MGFLDTLFARTKPVRPNLDALFAIPSAACTLETTLGLHATSTGAVCFKAVEGEAAARASGDALALLGTDPMASTTVSDDEYGYTWVTVRRTDGDLSAVMTALHAVNTTLVEGGFGPALLCTVVGFAGDSPPRRLGLVYLFKRGTIYPFAPTDERQRDTVLELQVRAQLAGEVPIEPDTGRWFPVWGTPALVGEV